MSCGQFSYITENEWTLVLLRITFFHLLKKKKRLPLELFEQWQKFLEFHWLKAPQNWTKNKWFKSSYLDFIYFRFFGRKSQNQRKLAKRITHFTIQFCPKNLAHFTKLSSLSIVKKILKKHSQKPFSLYKFYSKHVSGVYQKKNLHCTISKRPKTVSSKLLEIKYLYIPVNLCKKMFVPDTKAAFIRLGVE